MKLMLVAVLHVVLVVSLTHGAAIAAIDSAGAASSGQKLMTTAGETSSRTARQQQQPLNSNVVDTNNEPISRVLPGFPAVFQQPSINGDYQVKTWGNFGVAKSGIVFWGIAGILGLIIGVWVFSLFTGFEFFKTVMNGFHSFKGRADEMGFKMDNQQLNMMANQVYKAIDTWRQKNKSQ